MTLPQSLLLLIVTLGIQSHALAESVMLNGVECKLGELTGIGRFDYRDVSAAALQRKRLVEGAHFTRSVRSGTAGNTGSLMGDLDYVLRQLPNHPQALLVTVRHQQSLNYNPRQRAERRDSRWPTSECYFQRAISFAPDDPAVYLIMGIYQHGKKQYQLAEQSYLNAIQLFDDSATGHYNLGLLYTDLKRWDEAALHAERAYSLGYPLPGLKNRLQATGRSID